MPKKNGHDKPIPRTSAGLRDVLFEELEALKAGRSSPTLANATAKVVGEIISTVQIELNVAKFLHSAHQGPPKYDVLTLGTPHPEHKE